MREMNEWIIEIDYYRFSAITHRQSSGSIIIVAINIVVAVAVVVVDILELKVN